MVGPEASHVERFTPAVTVEVEEFRLAPIAPGSWLGLLGGGQLGRMFAMAAASLGYRVCVVDPDAASPAGAVCEKHLQAPYLDDAALDELAGLCRAVRPAAAAVAVAQDRIAEKRFMVGHGIEVAPHRVVERVDDLLAAPDALFPAILKTARLGYDGKGQVAVASRREAEDAWTHLGRVPCVLEKRLHLLHEVSCIVCRGADGQTVAFPLVENEHRGGILAVSIAPARVSAQVAARASDVARRLATALDYVGVLCVEMFVLGEEHVLVNEIAPRPHNSGHFEQQVRALAGMPLASPAQMAPAVMLNVLGDVWFRHGDRREPPWREVLAVRGAKLHLYGKHEPRIGRKMGHVTCLGSTVERALERAVVVAAVLGIEPPR